MRAETENSMTDGAERTGPLDGVRMVAIEQFGAGPFCSLFFADAGAEVIKVEDPRTGGDVGRRIPPGVVEDSSLYFETFNRGKQSIALDLTDREDRAVFEELVMTADVVFNNLRGDLPARLGLTYERLGVLNPAIVCASLSAYGRHGSRASEPGYDALIQAEAGWASLTGAPGDAPTKSGLSLVDYATGSTMAFGILAALLKARGSGVGGDVDASLYDVALSLLSYPATWWLSAAVETERLPMSAHPSIVPFQFFATADGHLAIACAKEKFFTNLVELLEIGDALDDPRFHDFEGRRIHRDEVLQVIAARLATEPNAHWLSLLTGAVPCAPVRSMTQALDVDELAEREMLVEYTHPTLGVVRTVGSPLVFSGFEPTYSAGPRLDELGARRRERRGSV